MKRKATEQKQAMIEALKPRYYVLEWDGGYNLYDTTKPARQTNCGAELTDVWGTTGDCTVLIEVKTSRSDFLADKRKYARSKVAEELNHQIGNYRYYLCPEGVITETDLPDNWGLLVYDGKKIHKVRMATKVESSLAMELLHITSVMSRILKPQIFNFRENVELKLIEKRKTIQ